MFVLAIHFNVWTFMVEFTLTFCNWSELSKLEVEWCSG
jgi:hypothetical protein